ncbi:MAG: class I SAM-dependent methyltransferase [Pseudomonadota bacterium]
MTQPPVIALDHAREPEALALAERLSPVVPPGLQLQLSAERLELVSLDDPRCGAVYVDFVGGAAGHRRRFGGGRGQAIAKAVGLKGGANPSVVDATGGLGRDAFVLASLGCRVTLIERSPVVAALLEDGLARAREDAGIGPWVAERMVLIQADAVSWMAHLAEMDFPEVVYLDPMFPHKRKSALVKKEMRLLQGLLGGDSDADALLPMALRIARKRVVVKRPDSAPHLAAMTPSMSISSKKHRFDVYVRAARA